jgi:hypothetical protein
MKKENAMFVLKPDHPLFYSHDRYGQVEEANKAINQGLDDFGKQDLPSTIEWASIAFPNETREALSKHGLELTDLDDNLFSRFDREIDRDFNLGVANAGGYWEDERFHDFLEGFVQGSFKEFLNFDVGFIVPEDQLAELSTSDFCRTMLEIAPELRAEVELRQLDRNTAQVPEQIIGQAPRWPTRPSGVEANTAKIPSFPDLNDPATLDHIAASQAQEPKRRGMRL